MNLHKSSFWIVMAGLVSVVIVALTWVLAISPTLTTTDESHAQAEQQRSSNDLMQLQLIKLAGQFKHLDEYKAELAAMQLQIPAAANLSEFNDELQRLADASGATLSEISPAPPVAFVPVNAAPAVVEAPAAEAGATTEATTEAAAPVAAVPTATTGMYDVQLSITVSGTYEQTSAFLSSLQSGSERLFLVMTVTATGTTSPTGASGGLPPMAVGDVTLNITGLAYVLNATAAPAVVAPADPAAPLVLPEPSGQKNPFVPVG